jgi:hypothetical protein
MSIDGVALATATIMSALLVAIQWTTTKKDNNNFVDRWQKGGGDNRQPLHWVAINCPAVGDHRHCLPGWRLEDQQQPQVEEDNNFDGLGGGADKAPVAPRPGAEDGAASNFTVDKASKGAKERKEERRSNFVW